MDEIIFKLKNFAKYGMSQFEKYWTGQKCPKWVSFYNINITNDIRHWPMVY